MRCKIDKTMSNDDYHADPAISKSDIDMLYNDGSYLLWKKNCPQTPCDNKTLIFGSALHKFILEPNDFDKEFIVEPRIDKRTKEGKKISEKFLSEVGNKLIITHSDFDIISAMSDSLDSHPIFQYISKKITNVERSIFYHDKKSDLMMKCRPDIEIKIGNTITLIDLKTINSLSNINKHVANYNYYVQAKYYEYVYSKTMNELHKDNKYNYDFLFIFISKEMKSNRYPVSFVKLSEEYQALGEEFIKTAMNNYLKFKNEGKSLIRVIEKPKWS